MATATREKTHVFLSLKDALALTKWSRPVLRRVVEENLVTTMQVPGGRVRYSKDDLERVAVEAIRPATRSLAEAGK